MDSHSPWPGRRIIQSTGYSFTIDTRSSKKPLLLFSQHFTCNVFICFVLLTSLSFQARTTETSCACRGDEGLHHPAYFYLSNFGRLFLHLNFISGSSLYSPGDALQFLVRSQQNVHNCLADTHMSLCGFYLLRSELARQWIICTPVTSTSSSTCNLSFERRCRLCSLPGSLGDVWQCADRYDYP